MSLQETSPSHDNGRLDAEVGMVRVLEEMARVPYDYLTYVIDPRQFLDSTDNVLVALGIARKGAIARVTTREELDQCILITPIITDEGRMGISVQSSPQLGVTPELGVCIDRMRTGIESIQKVLETFR